jgi:hypothetical protein
LAGVAIANQFKKNSKVNMASKRNEKGKEKMNVAD